MKNNSRLVGTLMLLITAMVWGLAFVFQSQAMDRIGSITLTSIRMLLGGLILLPICFVLNRNLDKNTIIQTLKSGVVCGVVLCVATLFQQYGIANTTVEKSGFISALYIVIVPLLGLFLGRRVSRFTWLCIAIALFGFYLLSFTRDFTVSLGDMLVFIAAICYSVHILVIDKFNSDSCDGLLMSCVQFLTAGILTVIPMLVFEHPDAASIWSAKTEILYMGVISCGIGYTFQILGQKRTPPVRASLIMCLESVFAALAGFLILHERLSMRELAGCILLMTAVFLININPLKGSAK